MSFNFSSFAFPADNINSSISSSNRFRLSLCEARLSCAKQYASVARCIAASFAATSRSRYRISRPISSIAFRRCCTRALSTPSPCATTCNLCNSLSCSSSSFSSRLLLSSSSFRLATISSCAFCKVILTNASLALTASSTERAASIAVNSLGAAMEDEGAGAMSFDEVAETCGSSLICLSLHFTGSFSGTSCRDSSLEALDSSQGFDSAWEFVLRTTSGGGGGAGWDS
mmetsp:Transcript_10592/g.17341  ORF Transcript_10592/g.17341 Transcript_10592/m.17341 type:complete len:228 (-) Transcript_10592:143-826(-)